MTEKKADKILFNGRLITMEDEALAQAIAIKGDRILYVGTTGCEDFYRLGLFRSDFLQRLAGHCAGNFGG